MADTVISVRGLAKRYGSTVALRDVSFDVRRGGIFGILGRNGAGKTTTATNWTDVAVILGITAAALAAWRLLASRG